LDNQDVWSETESLPKPKRFRTVWIWIVLIFLTLLLLSSNLGGNVSWNAPEELVVEMTAPFQELIKGTIKTTKGIWLKYFALIGTYDENTNLKRELDSLRMKDSLYRERLATNERLQELLQFKEAYDWPVVAAQVIGRDPSGWFESVIIDKGKDAGVKANMPVVNASGVVGRIVAVSANYAKLLLIIDQNSRVDCIIQRSRDRGILKGLSPEVCLLDYVLETSDVNVGDKVVTSGLGGVYPKGLDVGEVLEVVTTPGELFRDIKVRPMVDFSKLEELLIILREDLFAEEWKDED
jgi:rod shape-determining protein MreC